MKLKSILEELYPLHRTLVSDGTDAALAILRRYLPGMQIEEYPCGSQAWTWTVPPRYVVHDAYLRDAAGHIYADFKDTPLALVSYSPPVQKAVKWDELSTHLHYSSASVTATPWVYKYYDRDWGFCLPKEVYDAMPRGVEYYVNIRSEYLSAPGMKIGTLKIGENPREILVMAHIDHVCQSNDDAAGVVSSLEVARRLIENPLPKDARAVRFLFAPETIGSISFLSRHGTQRVGAGIFCEMTGNSAPLVWHRTKQGDTTLDEIAQQAIGAIYRPHGAEPCNDERVLESVGIPCISVNRWPYPEYHTSDDNPSIIHEQMLQQAADKVEQIVRIFASNYVPRKCYQGPLFLSGVGLFDRVNEKIAMQFGEASVWDIAQALGLDYWDVRARVERFVAKGLVERA